MLMMNRILSIARNQWPGAVLALLVPLAGCDAFGGGSQETRRLEQQVAAQKEHITKLEADVVALKQTVDEQREQIRTLQALGPERLDELVYPVRIELDRLTGGYDDDGRPGDDGVVAYVHPIDADGHIIKAAGSIVMEVFDLAASAEARLVTRAELDVPNTRKAWYGRLWTHHFTVRCPWPPPARKPPAHRDLTVKVQFTDLLTGKTLTAQKAVTIEFPPEMAETRQ
jgi:uncharacterized coiled-coil protein SlyX